MVIETDLLTYFQWLFGTPDQSGWLWGYLMSAAVLALAALVLGFIAAAVRHGPMKGGDITYRVARSGLFEAFYLSPRRVWALSRLAMQESLRKRMLVVFVVYVIILLFAGWFLNPGSVEPAKLYLDFVLTATSYLVLVLALFLSVFSLPNDFKNRTIYTIVTKPVRSGEIVLGRILGFSLVGTLMVCLLGAMSYGFVVRSLNHTHEISPRDLTDIPSESKTAVIGKHGQTLPSNYHRHELTIGNDGRGETNVNQGHWHEVISEENQGEILYHTGPPLGMFRARVPVYGELRFLDRTGKPADRGISVGNEWAYRSFIEGGTLATAIWTFHDIREEEYPDGLPLEMTIRVFRSYKGDIEKGILGSIVVRNPETELESDIRTFRAKDFYIDDEQSIPRKLVDKNGKSIDLFRDLVTADGDVEIRIQCLNRAQYFGVAKPDVYLRARDGRFDLNFFKGFIGIWVQMVLVTAIGVLFSTFLSGPVALLATVGSIVLGFFTEFIMGVVTGQVEGGGPVESLIRLVSQQNVVSELEEGLGTTVAQTLDAGLLLMMRVAAYLLPDFRQFSNADWVAYGFNIPAGLVLISLTKCLGYCFGIFIAGYFFLRIREVAK